jgi:hypothetical protein
MKHGAINSVSLLRQVNSPKLVIPGEPRIVPGADAGIQVESGCRIKPGMTAFAYLAAGLIISFLVFLIPPLANADRCIEGDCVNGKGTMVYSTGHKYTGEFKNGLRHGEGFMAMPGGRTLKGQFQYNAAFEGTYTYPDGKVYTGHWEIRERNGRGAMKYPDGRRYEGDFKSGLRHGKGIMTWPSGRRYEGDFVRSQRTGKGTMTYPDGRVYSGDFADGEQSGRGVMTFPDGKRLEGMFVKGEYAGQ